MSDWQPIETAPKNGSRVWVKRVYEGRIVKEGWAVFDVPDAAAPMLTPLGPDPLNRVSQAQYAAEAEQCERAKVTGRWLNADRMHAFPEPTHWKQEQLTNG